MRKSTLFLIYLTLNIILLLLVYTHASYQIKADGRIIAEKAAMVGKLQLTDLCLFTEASYTRHLSVADLHTPFQDSPTSLEHFPSGSLMMPPVGMRKMNGRMD